MVEVKSPIRAMKYPILQRAIGGVLLGRRCFPRNSVGVSIQSKGVRYPEDKILEMARLVFSRPGSIEFKSCYSKATPRSPGIFCPHFFCTDDVSIWW